MIPVNAASALIVPFVAVVDKLRIKTRLGSSLLCRMNACLLVMICFDFWNSNGEGVLTVTQIETAAWWGFGVHLAAMYLLSLLTKVICILFFFSLIQLRVSGKI